MWIDGAVVGGSDPEATANVTVRLADSSRTYDEKTVTLHRDKAINPVELAIPSGYEGQLKVRLSCGSAADCQSEEFAVQPLDAIQSLSLRLERTVYHPDDVGK